MSVFDQLSHLSIREARATPNENDMAPPESTTFYMGVADDPDDCLRQHTLGKDFPNISIVDVFGSKKHRKKLAVKIGNGRFKFSNLASRNVYVTMSAQTWMRSNEPCFRDPATDPATIYVETRNADDFKEPYLLRNYKGDLYAWSHKGQQWGLARCPGFPPGKEECKITDRCAVLWVHPANLFANCEQYSVQLNDCIDAMRDHAHFVLAFTSLDKRDVVALFGQVRPPRRRQCI